MRRPVKNRMQPQPDEVYGSFKIAKLIDYVMERGKKGTACKIVYKVMEELKKEGDPVLILRKHWKKHLLLSKCVHVASVVPTIRCRAK